MKRSKNAIGIVAIALLLSLRSVGWAQTENGGNESVLQLYQTGIEQYRQGELDAALQTFDRFLEIVRATENFQGESVALNQIGLIYAERGKLQEALELYQQALAIAQSIDDRPTQGKILNNIGAVYSKLFQYSQALSFYQRGLEILRQGDDLAAQIESFNNVGLTQLELGQTEAARTSFAEALTIARDLGDLAASGQTLSYLGNADNQLGRYADALQNYNEALTLNRDTGDRLSEGTTLTGLALVYSHLGQNETARSLYEQALTVVRETRDLSTEAQILTGLGLVYGNLGDPDAALNAYQQGLAIQQELGEEIAAEATLVGLAQAYENLGQMETALQYYQQALSASQISEDRATEATILNNIGGFYQKLGQWSEAVEFYRRALAIARELGNRATEGTARTNIGGTFVATGRWADAEAELRGAIEILESLRTGLSDADKVAIFDKRSIAYDGLQRALVEQDRVADALEVAERGRARAFVELLLLRVDERSASELATPTALSFAEIQQVAADSNATLVEYAIVADRLYIWVVSPDGNLEFRSVVLDRAIPDIAAAANRGAQLSRGMSDWVRGIRGNTSESAETVATRLQKSYNAFIAPIADLLPDDPEANIVIIPHKELFLVPFAALQAPDGRYLVETHTLSIAPSIQILDLANQQKAGMQLSPTAEPLVVGNPTMPEISREPGLPPEPLNPLPGAQVEAEEIARLLNAQPLLGAAATESAVVAALPHARIVHLATHGFLDDFGTGIPGALALAPSGIDDGLLTAREIFNLRLNAELVALSACDTGRGTITGDGTIGLTRAFITAGVPSLFVSLWAVPDAPTQELTVEFYRQLETHPNKARALRQAMLHVMQKYPKPRDWGAFILVGTAE